jgi:UDP-N-acetylmuramoyl-L-alanyl-D-glutamate--2,6-diaminopimelate ligase
MRLAELLDSLPAIQAIDGPTDVLITHITSDSRQVKPGALFVAYRGVNADLHRYIPDAISRGAAAVVAEDRLVGLSVPCIQAADGREALAWLAAAWHGHPSRHMTLVGITGTDGKTTTANLLFSILRAAGKAAGLISTVNAVIGGQEYDTGLHTTTPDATDVQRYLAQMRDAGTEIAVLEATSHGLAQHRVTACAFDVAVITNITHEHLDFHGTYQAYREAKALLFRSLVEKPVFSKKTGFSKTAVLNRDDDSFEFLSAIPTERVITYGVGGRGSEGAGEQGGRGAEEQASAGTLPPIVPDALHLTAVKIHHTPSGAEFDVQFTPSPCHPVTLSPCHPVTLSPCHPVTLSPPHPVTLSPCHLVTSLVGDFNISNILAATGAALALGIAPEAIQAGVRTMAAVPGRMERVDRGQPFTALVDFAHTPNALAHALETARSLAAAHGRVIVVFGSAGLRDQEKRWLMGEVAARHADLTVVTAEDPRTEDLAAIMAVTASALRAAGRIEGRDFVQIPDRQAAILYAVEQAGPGDTVILCGKGHEQSMCFGVREYPWRDQDALGWALETRGAAATSDPPFVLPTWTSA